MGTLIEFDFQIWVKTQKIYVLAGIEVLGYKEPGEDLYVKTSRCNQCGECCKTVNLGDWNNPPIPIIPAGHCVFRMLEPGTQNKYRCLLGIYRPFACCVEEPRDISGNVQPYCSVEYAIESRCSDKTMVIELPDWAEERNIYFCLADEIGTFAYKHPGENLFIKDNQCDQCGECCKDTEPWEMPPYLELIDNACKSLVKSGNKWTCELGINSCFTCIIGVPRNPDGTINSQCSQTFIEQT